jgi:D-alanine-D-alanine ligase-like ATP-grasp enzyme
MKTVLLVFNAVPDEQRVGIYGECASFKTITDLHQALLAGGNQVFLLNARTPEQVAAGIGLFPPIDLAFVIAEGFLDMPDTLYDGTGSQKIRQVIHSLNIPTSHSDPACMEVCRNKDFTYEVLRKRGIKVPQFITITPGTDLESKLTAVGLDFPLFVKPAGGGNSVGISAKSVVNDLSQLAAQATALFNQLGEVTLIAETHLSGQEYTIGVIGNGVKTVLPIIGFPLSYRVRSFESKRQESLNRTSFQLLTSEDPRYWQLYDIASASFDGVGASDIIRLEVREDEHKIPHVIDVNGTPSLSAGASLTYMAEYIGLSFTELINVIVYNCFHRYHITPGQELEELVYQPRLKLKTYRREVEEAV